MTTQLSQKQLLGKIQSAVDQSGWQSIVLKANKPFRLRIYREDRKGFDLGVYIWNCTHGGGAKRPTNEYRVQITNDVPAALPGATTLLLGWHDDYEVFVGFDLRKHAGQASKSPSIQVKEETLRDAKIHAFAIHDRQNGEKAVAFRSEFLVDYALNATSLHTTGKAGEAFSLLNGLDTLTDAKLAKVPNEKRRSVLSQILRKYRASDFRKRVLGAYEHKCAACGIQLELLDAAHIIPVEIDGSTDETSNGIALCKLHHAAYDRKLISFNETYNIEVSSSEEKRLTAAKRAGGLGDFKKNLRDVLHLPTDRRDYPRVAYLREARKMRKWTP